MDGSLTRLRLSGLRAPRRRLWLADDERAPLRPLRPFRHRQPLPAHARPPDPTDVRVAAAGEADDRGPCRGPRLALSGLASRAASCPTWRARSRPSGAARPRGRPTASPAWRPLLELQRAEGLEPAAAARGNETLRSWAMRSTQRLGTGGRNEGRGVRHARLSLRRTGLATPGGRTARRSSPSRCGSCRRAPR